MDSPERLQLAVSELEDYPPRIVLNLSPTGQSPAPILLKVIGMKTECSFTISYECESLTAQHSYVASSSVFFVTPDVPNVNTAELVVRMHGMFLVAML